VTLLPGFLEGLARYSRLAAIAVDSEPVGFDASVSLRLRRGGETFYDDNAWIGLALMQHYELTGDDRALSLARRTLAFIVSGWSVEVGWSRPGGIRWKQPVASTSRNTCSNGPVAELAIRVYERSGDPDAIEWSIRIYNWVRSALLGPDGLYYDNVLPDGTLDTNIWSYNQGTMIGAGVLLHRVTNDSTYLEQAIATAAASIRRFSVQRLTEQEPAFNAIFFRNLLLLDQVVPAAEYRSLATAYAEAMWQVRRDAVSGLFRGEGSLLSNSASMVTVYALVAGAGPRP
jgi:predicted alpha-1,6-mannanase (GH76 family)